MGFKDLSKFNDALLAKQTWCLLHDKSSFFYRVFKAKFSLVNRVFYLFIYLLNVCGGNVGSIIKLCNKYTRS